MEFIIYTIVLELVAGPSIYLNDGLERFWRAMKVLWAVYSCVQWTVVITIY